MTEHEQERPGARPSQMLAVAGTGTEVGKTWFAVRLAQEASRRGLRVTARKPVQSFAAGEQGSTDADFLAGATGSTPFEVCPAHRWYATPMAPVMAAAVLGAPAFTVDELVNETVWPVSDLALVETAGGLRSPLANDGDSLDLIIAFAPREVVLVAHAGLGTLHECRSAIEALRQVGLPTRIVLNHFDPSDQLHRANRVWLRDREGIEAEPPDVAIDAILNQVEML